MHATRAPVRTPSQEAASSGASVKTRNNALERLPFGCCRSQRGHAAVRAADAARSAKGASAGGALRATSR
eukprot:3686323-Pleurochrysis_carterae.AAC.2